MSSPLVFLDCETTGLEFHHDIWEVAAAVDDGPIQSFVVPHSLLTADPKALELNGYWDRGADAEVSDVADQALREVLTGATIVGANPAFDAVRLQLRWKAQPWHHRLIDVEAMAVGILGYDRPKGLAALAEDLASYGHDIPEPDHTAGGDVATTRAVYAALRAERAGLVEQATR